MVVAEYPIPSTLRELLSCQGRPQLLLYPRLNTMVSTIFLLYNNQIVNRHKSKIALLLSVRSSCPTITRRGLKDALCSYGRTSKNFSVDTIPGSRSNTLWDVKVTDNINLVTTLYPKSRCCRHDWKHRLPVALLSKSIGMVARRDDVWLIAARTTCAIAIRSSW